MLVKINGYYIEVYKHNGNGKYMFNLTLHSEPDICYLGINEDLKYILYFDRNEEQLNMPQTKIRRELKKLMANNH